MTADLFEWAKARVEDKGEVLTVQKEINEQWQALRCGTPAEKYQIAIREVQFAAAKDESAGSMYLVLDVMDDENERRLRTKLMYFVNRQKYSYAVHTECFVSHEMVDESFSMGSTEDNDPYCHVFCQACRFCMVVLDVEVESAWESED
jgi:hypothetical protein